MEPKLFNSVKFEKERAIARFNRSNCRVAKLRKLTQILVVFGLVSWCAPAVLKLAGGYFFNHHVVFLTGNAIVFLLLTLFRQNDVSGGRNFYEDYVKFSEAAAGAESGGGDCEEQKPPISQCDDLEAVIEKATRKIQRFQRTQSEILKREIAVRRSPELRRSETENSRKEDSSDAAAEIETLSSEEFRRRVDAFIGKHWIRKETASYQFEEVGDYQLRKNA